VIVPLVYLCVCTYFSLFRLKIFHLYEVNQRQSIGAMTRQIVPRETDAFSLLFNA
jgi:hypothetical protein